MQPPSESRKRPALNGFDISMVWGPDASDTLVDTRDGLLGALQLIPAGLPQQVRLPQDLFGLEIPDADCLLTSVDILSLDYGVLVWPWRDSDFDLGVCFGEGGKSAFQEGTAEQSMISIDCVCCCSCRRELTACRESYRPSRSNGSPNVCMVG